MSDIKKFIVFGGVYNNHIALKKLTELSKTLGVEDIYCLGDIGGFGPSPDKVFPLLYDNNVKVMQGNYDHSIGNRLEDCACGYVDPKDQHFAQVSYDYTLANTSDPNKDWLRDLPIEFRMTWGNKRILMSHGSPRRTNEFLWESTTPDIFIDSLLNDYDADILFITHTGIPWLREIADGRIVCNVGVIGRPPNDGSTTVDYVLVVVDGDSVSVEPKKLDYDFKALAAEMREEGLPEEFVDTVLNGFWTTCLEVLPAKERIIGMH